MRICSLCGESKEFGAFGFRNKAADQRHRRCKTCMASYSRQHYRANSGDYKTHSKTNSRVRRHALKAQIWSFLGEHPCVDCGQLDPVVLDFDHVEAASKWKELYWLVHETHTWTAIAAEIQKCEVRCANCHRRRTAAQFAWPKLMFSEERSTISDSAVIDTPRRQLRRPGPRHNVVPSTDGLTLVAVAEGLHLCRWCGVAKPLEQFHFRDKARQKRHSVCGGCFNAYRREHYRMNREDYIQRNNTVRRLRALTWQRRVWEYLVLHPCVDCAEPDPIVLEFDHVDRATKRDSVSYLARSGYPWATVSNEMAKCQVRCANCHRRRTADQFDWPRLTVIANHS